MDYQKIVEEYADKLIAERGIPLDPDGREFFINELTDNINRLILDRLPDAAVAELAEALEGQDTDKATGIIREHITDLASLIREAAAN